MIKNKPSISIVFPFLNDWGTVGSLVSLAIATAKKYTDDWEVIIINDGSKLQDREALGMIVDLMDSNEVGPRPARSDLEKEKKIRIIDHQKNKGYGGALRSGFAAASKDLIFYTDCDAQYDPREMSLLLDRISPDIGMVNGYKIKRNDPFHRVVAGRVYHHLVKFTFRLPTRDTDCDFRLIRRKVFDKVKLFEDTGTICVELVKKIDYCGFKIAEVPVHHFWRTSGKSQFFNFKRLAATGTNLLRLWWKLMVKREYYR